MSTTRRIAMLAVSTALAAVPIIGVQAAGAAQALPSPAIPEICHPKWVVGPFDAQYDAEAAAAGAPTEHPEGTVSWRDLTYNGC